MDGRQVAEEGRWGKRNLYTIQLIFKVARKDFVGLAEIASND